jgi:hypothetical protein
MCIKCTIKPEEQLHGVVIIGVQFNERHNRISRYSGRLLPKSPEKVDEAHDSEKALDNI